MGKTDRKKGSSDFHRLMLAMETAVSGVSEAMAICIEGRIEGRSQADTASLLWNHFELLYPPAASHSTGIDWHITDGLNRRVPERGHVPRPARELPRLVQLVLLHMNEAFVQTDKRHLAEGYLLLPSPLYIAVEALTVPQESHTRAFSILAGRILLSYRIGVWPRNAFTDPVGVPLPSTADWSNAASPANSSTTSPVASPDVVTESTIIEEIGNCRTWVEAGDIWSIKADHHKGFLGNFIAMRGVLLMRFADRAGVHFLRTGLFSAKWRECSKDEILKFQFRLSPKYVRLPPPSDFMNEILGVPVALRGMENVLFNGIKPSVGGGLVVQLAGGPGTGKTTFALALAAALARIGTQTLYISFEEGEADLVSKLRQQSQPRLNKLSYHSSLEDEWFTAKLVESASLDEVEATLILPLKRFIAEAKDDLPKAQREGAMVPPLPFLIVLDSLSALTLGERIPNISMTMDPGTIRRRLASFVSLCRQLRVLVILITSENRAEWGDRDLDYLVDMVISLRVEGAEEHGQKPVRLLSLLKSRHQISRHGTHIFHLSGDSGFRIAPQLSSQMDAQQDVKQLLWDRDSYIDAFNIRRTINGGYRYLDFIRLHWRSQILLQGKGSSGKAGLALRIALSPRYDKAGYMHGQDSARVLVLSFLYPPQYYEKLQRDVHDALVREANVSKLRGLDLNAAKVYVSGIPPVDVIHLTPGVLHAEDLHSKLVRHLEEGRLSGRPYTAVVIDGLHNLALQFPGASESSYLFPIIYGTLSRSNVTTITTFTTLALNSSELGFAVVHGEHADDAVAVERRSVLAADTSEESVFRLRVHLPLLHTLVQSSDYVLEVFRSDAGGLGRRPALQVVEDDTAKYLVRVQSAISREPPNGFIGWRRQEVEFVEPGSRFEEIQGSLPFD